MVAGDLTTEGLRRLIGRRVRYRGRELRVLEVLSDGPALVLSEPEGQRHIQANQFGEAGRRAPETWTIPVYNPGRRELHPLFQELGFDD